VLDWRRRNTLERTLSAKMVLTLEDGSEPVPVVGVAVKVVPLLSEYCLFER